MRDREGSGFGLGSDVNGVMRFNRALEWGEAMRNRVALK